MSKNPGFSLELPYESPQRSKDSAQQMTENAGRISLSGNQAKFSMVVENGILRYTNEGEQGRYILKPAPSFYMLFDREFCPANEHLTMHIAAQAYHIPTAECWICHFKNGEEAYITKRYDILEDGTRLPQEDFASLLDLSKANGGSDFKYNLSSYEECAQVLSKYSSAAMVDILTFYRLIVFNFLFLNDDAHLKNFSMISRNGKYQMAPAYDLMNTSLHLGMPGIFALKNGLFKEGMSLSDTRWVTRNDFMEFGKRIGLNERICRHELDSMLKDNPLVAKMVAASTLPDRLKDSYLRSHNYRREILAW